MDEGEREKMFTVGSWGAFQRLGHIARGINKAFRAFVQDPQDPDVPKS